MSNEKAQDHYYSDYSSVGKTELTVSWKHQ